MAWFQWAWPEFSSAASTSNLCGQVVSWTQDWQQPLVPTFTLEDTPQGHQQVCISDMTPQTPLSPCLLIHEPHIPGSYAILFFRASDFIFTTRHIHNWVWFPLWLSSLSGGISPLFPSCILDTYWPEGLIFQCHIFFAHHWLNVHEFEQISGDSEGQVSLSATVHGVTKNCTQFSNWTLPFQQQQPCLLRSSRYVPFTQDLPVLYSRSLLVIHFNLVGYPYLYISMLTYSCTIAVCTCQSQTPNSIPPRTLLPW